MLPLERACFDDRKPENSQNPPKNLSNLRSEVTNNDENSTLNNNRNVIKYYIISTSLPLLSSTFFVQILSENVDFINNIQIPCKLQILT